MKQDIDITKYSQQLAKTSQKSQFVRQKTFFGESAEMLCRYCNIGKMFFLQLKKRNAVFIGILQKLIDLDNLFEGDDQLKTNTALQRQHSKVKFKTI